MARPVVEMKAPPYEHEIAHPSQFQEASLNTEVQVWTGADRWESMEIELLHRLNGTLAYVMFCSVNDRGGVSQSITTPTGNTGHALANLQLKEKFPRKAVDGWQVEVLRAVASGLYLIGGVR